MRRVKKQQLLPETILKYLTVVCLVFSNLAAAAAFAESQKGGSEEGTTGEGAPAKEKHQKQNKQNKSKEPAMKEVTDAPINDRKPYSDDAIKHYNRGVELQESGFLNQAIAEYRGAIEADGRMEEAYSNLGVIYAAQRNFPKAKDAFQMAISLKPNRPTTLNGLGTVLYAQGKVKEAKDKWLMALSVDPKFASAYYNIGNAFENEKNLDEAVNNYVQAINVAPNMADAYFRIGIIYHKQRHDAQASALLRKAMELAPESDFVREAKRIEGTLEEEFVKSDKEQHSGRTVGALHKASSKEESKSESKKSKAGGNLNMFVQPDDQITKTGNNGGESQSN